MEEFPIEWFDSDASNPDPQQALREVYLIRQFIADIDTPRPQRKRLARLSRQILHFEQNQNCALYRTPLGPHGIGTESLAFWRRAHRNLWLGINGPRIQQDLPFVHRMLRFAKHLYQDVTGYRFVYSNIYRL